MTPSNNAFLRTTSEISVVTCPVNESFQLGTLAAVPKVRLIAAWGIALGRGQTDSLGFKADP